MAVAVPERAELSDELKQFIDEWKDKPGNLIMVLHRTQLEYGYLSEAVVMEVARQLGQPAATVFGVVTFYNYFKLTPPGRNRVAICLGTACYLKKADALTETFCETLGVELNGVTEDEEFSIEGVRCVGCCGLAPVVMVNGEVHGKLDPEGVRKVIDKYRNASRDRGQAAS